METYKRENQLEYVDRCLISIIQLYHSYGWAYGMDACNADGNEVDKYDYNCSHVCIAAAIEMAVQGNGLPDIFEDKVASRIRIEAGIRDIVKYNDGFQPDNRGWAEICLQAIRPSYLKTHKY